jgi:hypothetical protein
MRITIKQYDQRQLVRNKNLTKIAKLSYGSEGIILGQITESFERLFGGTNNMTFYVAYHKSEPIGILTIERGYYSTEINNFTMPKFRRKGIMRKLIYKAFKTNNKFRKAVMNEDVDTHSAEQDKILNELGGKYD